MERDLTTGSVFKTVIYFHCHICYRTLQTLYGMADLFCRSVWRGQQYDGGIESARSCICLTVMIVGLAMGATVMIGRHRCKRL